MTQQEANRAVSALKNHPRKTLNYKNSRSIFRLFSECCIYIYFKRTTNKHVFCVLQTML